MCLADDDLNGAVLQREQRDQRECDEPCVQAQRHEQLLQEQDHRQGNQVNMTFEMVTQYLVFTVHHRSFIR